VGNPFIFGDKCNRDKNWVGLLKNISLCYRVEGPDETRYDHVKQKEREMG
jgi:hypothetical protein